MYNSVRLFTSVCVLFAVTAAAFPAEPVSEDVDPHVRSVSTNSGSEAEERS